MLTRQNYSTSILWILLLINTSFLLIECSQQSAASSNQKLSLSPQAATNISSPAAAAPPVDPSNGVDDILKDTILLLDVLDEKLSVVKNRTPNAMMRDNLRALDGANDDDNQQHYGLNRPPPPQQQQSPIEPRKHQLPHAPSLMVARSLSEQEAQLAGRLDEEASIEEALVRLADGFASGRRSDHDGASEPLMAAASSPAKTSNNLNDQPHPINHNAANPDGQGAVVAATATPQGSTADGAAGMMDASDQHQLDDNFAAAARPSKRARQLALSSGGGGSGGGLGEDAGNNYQLASDSTERHIKFTLDLMQSIFTSQSYTAKTNLIESFLISPLSIQMVLMMMHLGARGQTRREISNCLHLSSTPSPQSAANNPSIQTSSSPSSLSSSNAADKSLMMQQIVGAGNDLTGPDSMGSKLKRRHQQQQQMLHQQQVSSDNAKQQSVSNAGNVSGKSRHQLQTSASSSVQQQQQQQPQISSAAAAAAATLGAGSSGSSGGNPHELFSGAMRNLLKDPIVMKSLTSANQIFLQKNLPLAAQYEWAIKHYYGADVKLVDFQHQSSHNSNEASRSNNNNSNKPHANGAPGDHSATAPNSTITNATLSNPDPHLLPLPHHHHHHPQRLNSRAGDENSNIQQMINDWIERQTKGKISNFLSSPISTSTLMMAINVLYFKGDWQYKFDPSDTETDAWFTQANGVNVKIPMMVNRLPLAFAHDPAMKTSVIELPYKAQRLGLFLLLPDEVSGIFHTMQMLNSTSFANLISSMRKPLPGADQGASGINVRIPKFSIESSPRLSQILSQQLGMKSLFMPDVADLSGMFGNVSPLAQSQPKRSAANGNLTNTQQHNGDSNQQVPLQVGLDELLHKAVLQVDEQGSVAAASSATIVERVGLFNSNYFEADHPFLLFLMDKQTGLVLFSGAFAGNNNNHETQQQRH